MIAGAEDIALVQIDADAHVDRLLERRAAADARRAALRVVAERVAEGEGADGELGRQKTAVRVVSVPEEQFEQQVESPNPPTVAEPAKQGTKKRPPVAYGRDLTLATAGV